MKAEEFTELQYGMFIHFGLYSKMARGEWAMNRERIAPAEMEKFARTFRPEHFDADELCQLAVDGGMRYLVFTTMHHDGFFMYDTALSPFNSMNYCGRNFVKEIVDSARKRGLKIVLYHSLNNWHDQPDAVSALEDPKAYQVFIERTFARLKELVTIFNPVDVIWYDGWWPFNSEGWQAERMNAELRAIQPGLLFNGRNGLPGDFGTPEQHLTAPSPWRPWEACVTLNNHWGFHAADQNWKRPVEVINMLLTTGAGHGNLLLNIGPRGDGTIPEESVRIVRTVGQWLREGGREAITNCDPFKFSPTVPQPGDRGDWDPHGRMTVSGNNLFYVLEYMPGDTLTIAGFQGKVLKATACAGTVDLYFSQDGEILRISLPESLRDKTAPVIKLECDRPAAKMRTGGMRNTEAPHPRYDPVQPDIQYE
ncbi:MAG: alpha-L-fucosidase [Lentisphaeria bacterium]|nr:alpha-L-fucosidase [Lentisphaeria bacterium]